MGLRDCGRCKGAKEYGWQGMSIRACVGAEGELVGQDGAWQSFPTLHHAIVKSGYATTKNPREAFLEVREERQGRHP